jgi:hypothetical protein
VINVVGQQHGGYGLLVVAAGFSRLRESDAPSCCPPLFFQLGKAGREEGGRGMGERERLREKREDCMSYNEYMNFWTSPKDPLGTLRAERAGLPSDGDAV